MTLTLFACMHEIRDGWHLLFLFANDFIMMFIFCVTWRPLEIKTYFVFVLHMPNIYIDS